MTDLPPTFADAPRNRLLAMMLGVAQTQLIRTAAELGLADLVQGSPQTLEALAAATGSNASALARVLRGLCGIGLLREDAGRFVATELTELLQTDHPNSLRDYARLMGSPLLQQTWPLFPHSVQTGGSAIEARLGQPLYTHLRDQPDQAALFNAAMTAVSRQESAAVLHTFDFSAARAVVDVGGGQGLLLASLLRAHPSLHGILLELPRMLDSARSVLAPELAAGRCTLIGGDFRTAIPEGGDVYILKRILIDCDDAQAQTLLTHVRTAIRPGGRLLIAEPDLASPFGTLFDQLMLLVFGSGSRVRPEPEMRALFAAAGFTLARSAAAPPTLRLFEGAPA